MNIVLNSPHEYRGFIINEFTKLELALDRHLLLHFFNDKDAAMHYRMHEVLLDRMTFDGKRTAVKGILDNQAKATGFIKTKNNSYPNGKLFDDVRRLIEIRNQFAHYNMVIDHTGNGSVITLLRFRDNINTIVYTQADFDELVEDTIKTTSDVLRLVPTGAE